MLGRRRRAAIYHIAVVGQVIAVTISAAMSAVLKIDITKLSGVWVAFATPFRWGQNWAWLIILITSLYIGIAALIVKTTGPPWVWDAIHNHLNLFQEYAFRDHADAMLHDHRVTLFRHVRFRFCLERYPWSGWLIPVERSGHTTRRKVAAFRAPDDAQKIEGVAGAAWASKGAVPISNLPAIDGTSSQRDIRAYADQTFVSVQWIQRYIADGKVPAVSFIGIPVEVKGKRWGVIVLDSKGEIQSNRTILQLYTIFARMLVSLLEKT